MIDPHRLSLLRDVTLSGSFAATAKSRGISPSAVSQQLARLERDTGVTLFEPAGRGVAPTPIALRLAAHAERILEDFEAAEALVVAARDTLSGSLRIATYGTYAAHRLPVVAMTLAEAHPELELSFVQLDPESAFEALTAKRVDLIVVDEYPGFPLRPQRGFIRERVAVEQMGLFLPGSAPPEHGGTAPVTLGDLAPLPWVFEPSRTIAYRWARNVCRASGFEPRVMFQSPDLGVHLNLVERGIAAAILPLHIVRGTELEPAAIAGVPGPLERSVDVIIRRGTERRPELRACLDAIHAEAQDVV